MDLPNSRIVENDQGQILLLEKSYPLSYIHGGYSLEECQLVNMENLMRIFPGVTRDMDIRNFIFLDTETTGLSVGTGTVAFLVGVGFFEKDCFILRQYFMRDYDEEPAMLYELDKLLQNYYGLVTFNGKSYDWNLIKTRYIFNRMKCSMDNPVHVDLLFPSRKLWSLRLKSCSLKSLESNILGEYRVDDIDGSIIPSVYFKFLDNGNTEDIEKVIRHNENDIISMISLLIKIYKLIENPLEQYEKEEELYGLGRIFEKSGEYNRVTKCLEHCVKITDGKLKAAALKRLSMLYKRTGSYEKSLIYWENMQNYNDLYGLYAIIELAKYYEHKAKDFEKALFLANKARDTFVEYNKFLNLNGYNIERRIERLMKKIGRANGG